ncbi:hypothetical protein C1646_682427 [Rhizophagus diaphanus]|nr:hypothetical protein C1646_682427 [Rhizophagus diaphanus] [Rhizophagus sp. MUCL 43196]
MEYVENVMNLVQEKDGVNLVMLKDLRITLKIGLVEIKILMNLYNIHNLMLYVMANVLNGYLMKNFKISLILQKVVLDILTIGILKIKNGVDVMKINMH